MMSGVSWEFHIDTLDPTMELIASKARSIITRWIHFWCPSTVGPRLFYVGVPRYLRRRWRGGDHLSYEESHSSKWGRLHLLSTHSHNVGQAEDALTNILRQEFGEQSCANIRGGGGEASRYKPSLLYVCVGRPGESPS